MISQLDLSTLDGTNGFRINGVDPGDLTGIAVSDAGDVNGDGFDDVIVGGPWADLEGFSGESAGESYVVFGKAGGYAANLALSALDGTNGFRLDGVDLEDFSGESVSRAGDVNGDGFDDLIVGASGADLENNGTRAAGESYVVFGTGHGFEASLDLSTLDGTNGFRLDGADAGHLSGFDVSDAGDVNGDGLDDVIIGTFAAEKSFVVFGASEGFGASLDLSTLDGTNGFRIDGVEDGDWTGNSVSGAGDVNGDGFDDVIVGARNADLEGNGTINAGESYVVFGKSAGFSASLDLSTLDGKNGFRIDGVDESDQSGTSVSGAGDVNGDGFDDLIVGASGADLEGNGSSFAGESYVIFGTGQGFDARLDLSSLDGTNGFRIDAVDEGDRVGISVSGAGDFNGDGFDDVIVGAFFADLENNESSSAGESYVVFGKSSDFAASLDLSALDGSNGFRIDGIEHDDLSGISVSAAGDVNGDGYDDVIVGADPPEGEFNGVSANGESYVIFGFSTGANTAPVITSSDAVNAPENQTSALDVQTFDDNDSEGAGLTYSITGGADAALFGIDAATGVVSFLSAPDFETPGDDNSDNDYEVQVTVTDSGVLTDVQDLTISVTDEDDTPTESDFTYTLVDTDSDTEVGALFDGITFDPGAVTPPGERSILVDFIGDGVAGDDDGSMRLQLFDENGNLIAQRLENAVPYVLFGDNAAQGFFDPTTPLVDGSYALTATMFSQNGAKGTVLGTETIDFTLGEVIDPDPALDLTINQAGISENGGTATGTVTRLNGGTSGNLVVTLNSDDTSEATVPTTVTILDGFASANFQITAQDDVLADGDVPVSISAAASGFDGDSEDIVIEDDDTVPTPPLFLSIDMSAISENGGTATGTVTRIGTDGNLVVTLASDDTSEATVPTTVTILDGFGSVDFQITAVDDAVLDGDIIVSIDATAPGNLPAPSVDITIEDDEVPPPVSAGFEIGSATVQQSNGSQFFSVTFTEEIENARVVLGPVGFNGNQPATTRVMNVTDQGFEFQVAEWQYLNGAHVAETVFWMAMSEGDHTLADGTVVSAGRTTLEDDTAETIALSGFSEGPAVFGQVTSFNEVDTVADRISNVSSSGFTVRMQEEEALQNGHAEETFDWIAIEYGDGSDIDVANIAGLGSAGDTFVFDAQPDVALLADMQSFKGKDTAVLRYDDLETDSARLFVEEEKSANNEVFHLKEEVALLTADIGTYDLFG